VHQPGLMIHPCNHDMAELAQVQMPAGRADRQPHIVRWNERPPVRREPPAGSRQLALHKRNKPYCWLERDRQFVDLAGGRTGKHDGHSRIRGAERFQRKNEDVPIGER
jgi:hypothetical protein